MDQKYIVVPVTPQSPFVLEESPPLQTKQGSPFEVKYDLENKNLLQRVIKVMLILKKVSPAFLGLIEQYTIINYYSTQRFGHKSIKEVCLGAIVFSPLAMGMIWGLQFLKQNYQNRDQTDDLRRLQLYNQMKRKRKRSIKFALQALKMFTLIFVIQLLQFLFFMLHSTFWAIIYAILQVLNILPYFIGFEDKILRQIKFPITQPLVTEFLARQDLFEQENYIKLKNSKIIDNNLKSKLFNDQSDENQQNQNAKKPIKQLVPMPQIFSTHPLKAAQIMNSEKSYMNTLLTDPYVSNFLEITQLIKAVFQSLPMLILQYINNSELDLWHGQLNVLTFLVSVLGVIISSISMINTISKSETFPLLDFKRYVDQNMDKRGQDPLWLLQLNTDEDFLIYDLETLKIAAFANKDFYRTIKGIRIDITQDSEFILKCKDGENYPFKCLSNIILNMNQDNEFHMQFSHNREIKLKDIKILFNALKYRNFKKITIEANFLPHNIVQDSSLDTLEKLITDLLSTSKCRDINFQFNDNFLKFDGLFTFEANLQSLKLSLQYNQILDLKFLSELQFCTQLQTIHLNFGQNKENMKIENTKPLEPIFSLPLLKDIDIDLSNNLVTLNKMNFAEHSLIENLNLNLQNCLLIHLYFCDACHVLTKLRQLNLNINSVVQNIDGLKAFSKCEILQSLNLRIGNQITKIESISFIRNFNHLQTLHLDFNNNRISNISELTLIKNLRSLQTIYLDLKSNQIQNIESLSVISELNILENCHIDLGNNKVQSIEVFKCFEETKQLINLRLELENNLIERIDCLYYLRNLYYLKSLRLDFNHNKIQKIDSLCEVNNLKNLKSLHLNFNFNMITILEPLNLIQHLINLENCHIEISNNQIDSVQVFEHFAFTSHIISLRLDLGNNQIKSLVSLSWLQNLYKLQTLDLDFSQNQIGSIHSLENLTSLKQLKTIYLNFDKNQIPSIQPLSFIGGGFDQLENCHISLSENLIDSISVFECFSLTKELISLRLDLGNNHIQCIDSLHCVKTLFQLKTLDLDFNQNKISSVNSLAKIEHLRLLEMIYLNFDSNMITSIKPLKKIKHLSNLEICHVSFRENQIDSIEVFKCFSETKKLVNLFLDLGVNKLTNVDCLSSIERLVHLRYLNLNFNSNKIQDISCISAFKTLTFLIEFKLFVQDTLVKNTQPIQFVKNMNKLKTFNLGIENKTYGDKEAFLSQRSEA